ncbi:MAG: hypothetical protein IJI54_09735 [Kiritimatiellae bacterium]|nr:hypothetical protein [Kiritimatiellia bacterium]
MADPIVNPVMQFPEWLDDYVYNELNAQYDPFLDRFMARDLPSEELRRRYLGTYFPRSYAESRSIFTNYFNASQDCLKDKTEVSILDFGCGTGGDLFGLIDAIIDCRSAVRVLRVFWCDVSDAARSVFCQLISKWRQQNTGLMLSGKAFIHDVHTIDDFRRHAKAASQAYPAGYDIVTSFKAINEVYQGGYSGQPYKDFYDVFWPLVKDNGAFCVEDLTFRHPDDQTGVWIPNLLGEIPLPLSAIPVSNSTEHHQFPVRTSRSQSDFQKVAYKLFIKDENLIPPDWSF